MAPSDPSRLLRDLPLERFPFRHALVPRIGDVDPLRHLNNVAIADYYYDARVRFLTTLTAPTPPGVEAPRLLVRRVELDYLLEGTYPDELQLGVGITSIGSRSWTMGTVLHQHGACIGTSLCVMVAAGADGPTPLPDGLRAVLDAHLLTSSPT